VVTKNLADGHGDIGRRQRGTGYLIKQRLEEMVVCTIDDDDLAYEPLVEGFCCLQAAKSQPLSNERAYTIPIKNDVNNHTRLWDFNKSSSWFPVFSVTTYSLDLIIINFY
jgi:hypothetical protein